MNAKEELLNALVGRAKLKCASIQYGDCWDESKRAGILLKPGYSEADFEKFLEQLNFEYDDGYGGQELFGTVWLKDDTWFSRGEYDGSEWWKYNILPTIPAELLS